MRSWRASRRPPCLIGVCGRVQGPGARRQRLAEAALSLGRCTAGYGGRRSHLGAAQVHAGGVHSRKHRPRVPSALLPCRCARRKRGPRRIRRQVQLSGSSAGGWMRCGAQHGLHFQGSGDLARAGCCQRGCGVVGGGCAGFGQRVAPAKGDAQARAEHLQAFQLSPDKYKLGFGGNAQARAEHLRALQLSPDTEGSGAKPRRAPSTYEHSN